MKKMPTGLDKVVNHHHVDGAVICLGNDTSLYDKHGANMEHTTYHYRLLYDPVCCRTNFSTLLLRVAKFPFNSGKLAAISIVAYIVTIASVLLQSGEIALIATSVQKQWI